MDTMVILVIICGLVVLFALEVRHSETNEEIKKLKSNSFRIDEEIIRLKAQMKMKKDAYEEHKPTMLYPPGQSTV
jgi:hypothetical protein